MVGRSTSKGKAPSAGPLRTPFSGAGGHAAGFAHYGLSVFNYRAVKCELSQNYLSD